MKFNKQTVPNYQIAKQKDTKLKLTLFKGKTLMAFVIAFRLCD